MIRIERAGRFSGMSGALPLTLLLEQFFVRYVVSEAAMVATLPTDYGEFTDGWMC